MELAYRQIVLNIYIQQADYASGIEIACLIAEKTKF